MKIPALHHPFVNALLCGILVLLNVASQADTTEPTLPADLDVSRWACKYCAFEYGISGELEFGVGNLSGDAMRFGEYNGLYEEGPFSIANLRVNYLAENGRFYDLSMRNLTLDNQTANFTGGLQGRYEYFLDYSELMHTRGLGLSSIFTNNGSAQLQLPENWVPVGQSSDISTELSSVDLQTQRKRINMGALYIPAHKWETAIDFRRDIRDGNKRNAGAFFFNSVQMLEPVDYVTDELELSATYTDRNLQSRLTFYGSQFKNENESLTWSNAFGPIASGADQGQLALPPDNQFQQLRLTAGYHLGNSRINADIARGSMSQTSELLAPTLNQGLLVQLPQDAGELKVDTLTGSLRLNSTLNRKVQVKAFYRIDERDNKTQSQLFNWVTTDAYPGVTRRNLPYSFRNQSWGVESVLRPSRPAKISVGYDFSVRERSYQDVEKTEEDSGWGKVRVKVGSKMDLQFRLSNSRREASGFNPVADIEPAQNPLMRKYNMADRDRIKGYAGASFFIHERVALDIFVDSSRDHYKNSPVGLTEARDLTRNADLTVVLTDKLNFHFFGTREKIVSKQAGSESYSAADWFAHNEDIVKTVGGGVNYSLMGDRVKLGMDYMHSDSAGNIRVDTYVLSDPYPQLTTDYKTLNTFAEYAINENLFVKGSLAYESYVVDDWQMAGLAVDELVNVISLGYNAEDYDVVATMMSVHYRF
ncbi:MtrB/PioB family decaheme-associated outer membrane protein [Teredinibacter franksiae]|uniref:MtrB/PioB family decaheme-associated outer membrane protein n=1 Tax=Teredinibacter franksiae TaxID=2761453 RepID=UPI0016248366|nr:MtrB/PioB family decaheme-associated outer membrane protein [Teredinibacter franksiae]